MAAADESLLVIRVEEGARAHNPVTKAKQQVGKGRVALTFLALAAVVATAIMVVKLGRAASTPTTLAMDDIVALEDCSAILKAALFDKYKYVTGSSNQFEHESMVKRFDEDYNYDQYCKDYEQYEKSGQSHDFNLGASGGQSENFGLTTAAARGGGSSTGGSVEGGGGNALANGYGKVAGHHDQHDHQSHEQGVQGGESMHASGTIGWSDTSSKLSKDAFTDAKAQVVSEKRMYEQGSHDSGAGSDSIQVVSQSLDPQVGEMYKSCIELKDQSLQLTQVVEPDGSKVSVGIKLELEARRSEKKPQLLGIGVNHPEEAECTVVAGGALDKFPVDFVPGMVVNAQCTRNSTNTSKFSERLSMHVYTNFGGPYRIQFADRIEMDTADELRERQKELEKNMQDIMQELKSRLAPLEQNLSHIEADIKDIKADIHDKFEDGTCRWCQRKCGREWSKEVGGMLKTLSSEGTFWSFFEDCDSSMVAQPWREDSFFEFKVVMCCKTD